jgi:phosphoglycerate dehydrogenase-like enzyme
MQIVVAIYSPFRSWCIPAAQVEWLRREFPQHVFVHAPDHEAALAAMPGADVAFSSRITAAHLAAAPRLRWVHSPAAGVGAMLFPEMIARDVVMTNSRGISAGSIAEHTIAVALSLLRSLPYALDCQRERRWAQDDFEGPKSIRLLRGAEVLVVGLGAIGSEVARLADAFGARVTGIRRRPDAGAPPGVSAIAGPEDLRRELPRADVVVIAAPQTNATVHLIGAAELARMKPDAVLVNVSRGKLVDEAALAGALAAGRLRGAALDVFDHEPLDAGSPLWGRGDVIVTPHVSGFHAGYWRDAAALFAGNLRRFEAGAPLRNVVDKQAGY